MDRDFRWRIVVKIGAIADGTGSCPTGRMSTIDQSAYAGTSGIVCGLSRATRRGSLKPSFALLRYR